MLFKKSQSNRQMSTSRILRTNLEDSNDVNHPLHYGGEDNPYEAIKVIESWGLNFNLGNVIKYISRAGKKDNIQQDLEKALWYLQRELDK